MTKHTPTINSNTEQPGRLFNKLLNLEHYIPEQHLGRKLGSYHGNEFPSMIGSNENRDTSSPVCVQDVKHFEALHYQDAASICDIDDAGGVAIDLCLPEPDDINVNDYEDDDLMLGFGLELESTEPHHHHQVQQQQQSQHQLLPVACAPPRSINSIINSNNHRRRHRTLAPILEERKVTFAAKHVVLRVDHNNDSELSSYAIDDDQRFVHQVFDAVQVWFIPHHTEYDAEERCTIWYSPSDMASMKEDAMRAKMLSYKQQQSKQRSSSSTEDANTDTCPIISPLAALLRGAKQQRNRHAPSIGGYREDEQQQQQQPRNNNDNPYYTTEQHYRYSRRCRYEAIIDAVLLEQYEQRIMCVKVYGRVDPSNSSGIIDPDRLARVYSHVGDTRNSHDRAVAKALFEGDYEDNSVDGNINSNHNQHTALLVQHQQYQPPAMSLNALKRSPSFIATTSMAMETSHCFGMGVTSLFEYLLSPFLEIRSEDLFLGIGEEMSVAAA